MTMILREDIGDGLALASEQRGEDALISHDNGLTWNLDHRITIDSINHDTPTPTELIAILLRADTSPPLCSRTAPC